MKTKTIGGIVYNVYTQGDWERDKSLNVKVGWVIEPKVFYALLNAVPPTTYRDGVFQCGEAASHELQTGTPLYGTFKHIGDNYYKYYGEQREIE